MPTWYTAEEYANLNYSECKSNAARLFRVKYFNSRHPDCLVFVNVHWVYSDLIYPEYAEVVGDPAWTTKHFLTRS